MVWERLDTVAHFLHTPLMFGHRITVARWYHRLHLLPGWALNPICDRYDLALGITRDELRRTSPVICPHITSYSGITNVTCGCGGRVVTSTTSSTSTNAGLL